MDLADFVRLIDSPLIKIILSLVVVAAISFVWGYYYAKSPLIRRIWIKVLTAMLSALLFTVGLYQIEILWVQFQNRESWNLERFVLPFGVEVEWWVARDIWYSCLIVGYLLLCIVCIPSVVESSKK